MRKYNFKKISKIEVESGSIKLKVIIKRYQLELKLKT